MLFKAFALQNKVAEGGALPMSGSLLTNLSHYYSCDSNFNDLVGSNNVTVNGMTSTTGLIGNAYSYDGVNDFGNPASNYPANTVSMNVWFKFDYATLPDGGYAFIGSREDGSVNHNFVWYYDKGGFNCILLQIRDGGVNPGFIFGSQSVTDSNWHMATVTKTPTSAKIYLDGNINGHYTFSSTSYTSLDFDIGRLARPDGSTPSQYFDGALDEIGIWSKELTSTEITELYNNGFGRFYP